MPFSNWISGLGVRRPRDREWDEGLPGQPSASLADEGIFGRFLALGSGEVLARGVAFIGAVYLTRRLGPYGFGVVGFASALCGYLALSVSAGFNELGAREVARQPEKAASIAAGVVLVRLVLSTLVIGLAVALVTLLQKPHVVKVVVVLTSLSFASLALDTAWAYKGLSRPGRVGIALVLSQALYLAALLGLVRGSVDVVWVPVSQVFGELAGALFLGFPLLRSGDATPDFGVALRLLRASGALTLSRLLRTLIYTFDVVLLAFLIGEVEVGLYSAAYRFCFLTLAIGLALHAAYLPGFVRAVNRGHAAVARLAERALAFAWSLALPMVVGGAILARPLLVGLFGAEYGPVAGAFRLLLVSIGFIYLHGVLHNVFLVFGRLRTEMWVMAVAAGLNVGCNLLLIPHYGIVGAAAATAGAEGLILLLFWLLLHSYGIRPGLRKGGRVVVATIGMTLVLILLGPKVPWLLRLAAGLASYAALLTLLGALPADLQSRSRDRPRPE